MTYEELEQKNEQIIKEIRTRGLELSKTVNPIYDGIYTAKDYLDAKYKVVFLLKEGYDTGDALGGGDWSFGDCFENSDDAWKIPTWQVLSYIMHGIFENKKKSQLEKISKDNDMIDILKKCAIINLSKMPGSTTSGDMAAKTEVWKDIVRLQLETYDPDAIICGNTANNLCDQILNKSEWSHLYNMPENNPVLTVCKINNAKETILIDAYHPANTVLKREDYVDSIVDAVRKDIIDKNLLV